MRTMFCKASTVRTRTHLISGEYVPKLTIGGQTLGDGPWAINVIAADACANHSVLELLTPSHQLVVDQPIVYAASIRDAFGNPRTEGASINSIQ